MKNEQWRVTGRWRRRAMTAVFSTAGAAALAAAMVPAASAAASQPPPLPHLASVTAKPVSHVQKLGTVSLRTLAAAAAKHASTAPSGKNRVAPLRLPPALKAAARRAAGLSGTSKRIKTSPFAGNVKGELGFDGLTAPINAGVNAGVDSVPPDQGLGVGPSSNGTVAVEFVNNVLNMYTPGGKTLLGAIPSYLVFGQPVDAFLTDPRVYWDPQTRHWFLTMFEVGASTSTQFVDVSQTTDPLGGYTIFSIDTTDAGNTAGGCPCLGDFDQVGADHNGFYIATNEFSINGPNFNGSIIYAASKSGLISAANGGPLPAWQSYVIPTGLDPFGAYHLSPSSVTQGSASPGTEYFVESDSNDPSGAGLLVFELQNTAVLNSGGAPTPAVTGVDTEPYALPPNADQKNGPIPFGNSAGVSSVGQLQTDFNAVQEVTYAGGTLYAELNTALPSSPNAGVAWFALHPWSKGGSSGVKLAGNGYVQTSQNLLYPDIGVNRSGNGFLGFAVSGTGRYPSAAYMAFHGSKGPGGPVHIAAAGTAPLDDFDCYPPFSSGQCRYGDYSMAQAYNGRIYLATEYVAPQPRDVFANWATRVWSAPAP